MRRMFEFIETSIGFAKEELSAISSICVFNRDLLPKKTIVVRRRRIYYKTYVSSMIPSDRLIVPPAVYIVFI